MNREYFMRLALNEAEKALSCAEFPVGCVLVHRDSVVATGSRKGTAGSVPNETDHAEIVALRQLTRLGLDVDRAGITAFCTLEPCLMCFGAMLLHGIGHIVYAYEDVMGGGTGCDLSTLPALYTRNDISIVSGVFRDQSRALFKTFFSNPNNTYWNGSLLESYTLSH